MARFVGRLSRARTQEALKRGDITHRDALELDANRLLDSGKRRERERALMAKAEEIVRQYLTDAEVREKMKFTDADIEALDRSIHSPGRNAMAVQGGLKLKALVNGLLEKEKGAESVNVTIRTLPSYAPSEVTTTTTGGILAAAVTPRVVEATDADEDP